jgi:hypothetical protein
MYLEAIFILVNSPLRKKDGSSLSPLRLVVCVFLGVIPWFKVVACVLGSKQSSQIKKKRNLHGVT